MTFGIATHNQGKLREMREILGPHGHELLSLRDVGISEVPEEDGETFEANALIKARACLRESGLPSIADDSGLCVDALDGAPGVYSARYGGMETDEGRIDYLLKRLDGVQDRRARFVCAAACVFPDGADIIARGECEGVILGRRRGAGGFGYDPVFFVPGLGKSFAELDAAQKNALSHRGKAMRELAKKLS
jgi:XTP/dITP diphosphohydrolase